MRYLFTFILVLVLFVGCKKGENPVDPWDANNAMGQPCPGILTVTYSGKTYNTINIGSQCWLKENLNIGTKINGSNNQTNNGTIEKFCFNDNEAYCDTFGGFYQWNEAMQYSTTAGARGICPAGWHIPTLAEFETLKSATSNNGNSLKAIGQGSGSGAGTNTSGFSALLAGYRDLNGYFCNLGYGAYFWSSTENDATYARNLTLDYNVSVIYFDYYGKHYGFSVRCIKD